MSSYKPQILHDIVSVIFYPLEFDNKTLLIKTLWSQYSENENILSELMWDLQNYYLALIMLKYSMNDTGRKKQELVIPSC